MDKLFDLMRSVIALGSKLKCSSMIGEADHCDKILEGLREITNSYVRLKDNAELGAAIKWAAGIGMFPTDESGLKLALKRYREAHKEEEKEPLSWHETSKVMDVGESVIWAMKNGVQWKEVPPGTHGMVHVDEYDIENLLEVRRESV